MGLMSEVAKEAFKIQVLKVIDAEIKKHIDKRDPDVKRTLLQLREKISRLSTD